MVESLKDEILKNKNTAEKMKGKLVSFGEKIMFRHLKSGRFITGVVAFDNQCV